MEHITRLSGWREESCYSYGCSLWETANAESLWTEQTEGQTALQLWPLSLGDSKCRTHLCRQSRWMVKLRYSYGHFPWETANAEPIFADRVDGWSNYVTTMATFLGRQQMQNPSLQTEQMEGKAMLHVWPLFSGGNARCKSGGCRRWASVPAEARWPETSFEGQHSMRNIVCR